MPNDQISDPEDLKLLTLARGARGRIGAESGAALRDETGRTYATAAVDLPSLTLSAVRGCVAQAVASGARGVEALVVVGGDVDEADLSAVVEAGGSDCTVWLCASDGSVRRRLRAGGAG